MQVFSGLLFTILFSVTSQAGYRLHYKVSGDQRQLLSASRGLMTMANGEKRLVRRVPYYMESEDKALRDLWYEEYEVGSDLVPMKFLNALENPVQEFANTEVRELVNQGPKENRINLTILGDGYTLAEKERFFADCERTVRGLFEGRTFQSYLPLFNINAVFVASAVSGIGDGSPKNTAFRLYRNPAGSKRAIMPGDEGALERALDLAPATDYPIVLANDEYYGGLGGRYAISTRSVATGLIVLRHELGHNFGEVGEEYDNGYVYTGANASSSSRVPWAHWLDGQASVYEGKLMSGDYVWKNLRDGKYSARFTIPNMIEKMIFVLSSVGWETANDVEVKLNNQPLSYSGVYHGDRSFFSVDPQNVTAGQTYELSIAEKIKDNDNVLGFALAYGLPAGYDTTANKIAAFATFNASGSKSYRPTHSSCLMRNMEVENFCVVDQENMWTKFLGRVKLIDEVKIETSTQGERRLTLHAQNLPGLSVKWYSVKGGLETEILEARDQMQIPATRLSGTVRAKVEFRTTEVRKYTSRFNDVATIQL